MKVNSSVFEPSGGVGGDAKNVEGLRKWQIESHGRGVISSIEMIEYGASLSSVRWGDREICLGYDTLEGYRRQGYFMGATVGRFANRIAAARFSLDGREYPLVANEGLNSLHGGPDGFSGRNWRGEVLAEVPGDDSFGGVSFRINSPDGEGGYPGDLDLEVRYILAVGKDGGKSTGSGSGDSYLIMHFRAESSAATPVNLTNHAYWNLAGEGSGSLREHHLALQAGEYVDVDESSLPTGVLSKSNCGTGLLDLQNERDLGSLIYPRRLGGGMPGGLEMEAPLPGGIDHCYVLDAEASAMEAFPDSRELSQLIRRLQPRKAATLRLGAGGRGAQGDRVMEVYTSYPGLQVYTGNYLDEKNGRGGQPFPARSALCLEAQYFPDSPNQPSFPDSILRPGKIYEEITVHRFSVI